MKKIFLFLFCMLPVISCNQTDNQTAENMLSDISGVQGVNNGSVDFSSYFLDKTMRLDYFHSGTSTEEHFATDRIVSDGIWSGSKKILIDDLQLGLYFFEVVDNESKTLLYSRGFASIFGEWQTIPEASEKWGTFHESIRLPWPTKPVTILLKKRDTSNNFKTIWSTDIDPASRQVNPADLVHTNSVDVIVENGPADQKVDLVILGDGYSKEEMEKFRKDAKRLSGYLMNAEPFKSRSNEFNIRAIETPGEVSGVNKPHPGVFKTNTFDCSL